ncbi:MAG: hypothetical protein M5R36_16255, partial [Deltaproteobacteria bacterium]|nr:hypothetical protein [Deltaproteobacteria bacterium]
MTTHMAARGIARARVEIFGKPEREYEHVDFGYDWIAGTRRLRGARFTLKGCEERRRSRTFHS